MSRINLYLDTALWTAFRVACLSRHISASKMIAALIQQQLLSWQQTQQDDDKKGEV